MRTNESAGPMLRLVGVGEEESGSAFTTSGWPSQDGITSHRIQSQALSELLSSLEREVADLNSKYCEAYVTLLTVMEHLVRLGAFINSKGTTDV